MYEPLLGAFPKRRVKSFAELCGAFDRSLFVSEERPKPHLWKRLWGMMRGFVTLRQKGGADEKPPSQSLMSYRLIQDHLHAGRVDTVVNLFAASPRALTVLTTEGGNWLRDAQEFVRVNNVLSHLERAFLSGKQTPRLHVPHP